MTVIKAGYADYPLDIRVSANDTTINLDIDQYNKYRAEKLGKENGIDSTLAYVTLEEAISLRNELNVAIKKVAGV